MNDPESMRIMLPAAAECARFFHAFFTKYSAQLVEWSMVQGALIYESCVARANISKTHQELMVRCKITNAFRKIIEFIIIIIIISIILLSLLLLKLYIVRYINIYILLNIYTTT